MEPLLLDELLQLRETARRHERRLAQNLHDWQENLHEAIIDRPQTLRLARSFGNQKSTGLQQFIRPLQNTWKIIRKMKEIVSKKDITGAAHRLCRGSINKEVNVVYTLFHGLGLTNFNHLGGEIGGCNVGNR